MGRPATYASVYNAVFALRDTTRINRWLHGRLTRGKPEQRGIIGAHVVRLARTQRLGRAVEPSTLALARRSVRLRQLAGLCRLRRLQRRVVAFLWRPGGALFLRHVPHEFVESG